MRAWSQKVHQNTFSVSRPPPSCGAIPGGTKVPPWVLSVAHEHRHQMWMGLMYGLKHTALPTAGRCLCPAPARLATALHTPTVLRRRWLSRTASTPTESAPETPLPAPKAGSAPRAPEGTNLDAHPPAARVESQQHPAPHAEGQHGGPSHADVQHGNSGHGHGLYGGAQHQVQHRAIEKGSFKLLESVAERLTSKEVAEKIGRKVRGVLLSSCICTPIAPERSDTRKCRHQPCLACSPGTGIRHGTCRREAW